VYGAQLGLVPVVILALFADRSKLSSISTFCAGVVMLSFLAGWGSAVVGKLSGNGDLVFLSPVVSLVVSLVLVGLAYVTVPKASGQSS